MSDLYHDQAEQAVYEHAERVLDAYLPAALSKKLTSEKPTDDARASVAYVPSVLMKPQDIFFSNEALELLMHSSEHQHIVLCLYAFGQMQRKGGYSGTDTVEGQVMTWTLRAEVAFVAPDSKGGYRQVRKSGRLETQREFSRRLARIYRDATIDVLLKHLQGKAGIQTVRNATRASDTTSFDSNQRVGRAHGDLRIEQAMLIPKPLHQVI